MSKVDDELTRRLQRAERPVDGDALFDGLVTRRSHRERLRRVQAGLVALAVLAATAGGFVVLKNAFDPEESDSGSQLDPFPSNGSIVFSRTSSGSEHLYLIEADGTDLRQITDGNASDQFANWSPDGRRIVFLRQDRASIRLYVLDVDSGDTQPITPPSMGVYRPAWSPDGELIAFAGIGADVRGIWVVRPDGSGLRRITEGPFNAPDAPRWSPDGSTIAFTSNLRDPDGGYRAGWDVYLVGRDGSGLRNLTETPDPERSESPIGWLPDGNLLLSESPGTVGSGPGRPIQMGRWLEITAAGELVRTVREDPVNTEDHLQEPRLSPDGRFVIFDSGRAGTQEVWFIELTTMEFTQVTTSGGWLPAWQPIQIGSDLSPPQEPEPSISPDPEPAGRDIGIGFNLCSIERLGGVDWFGDGTDGTAWTGTRVDDRGRCGRHFTDSLIAGDLDGDGSADAWTSIDECMACEPWAATDLDGNGTEELVVMLFADLQPTFAFYFAVPDGLPRSSGIYPIFLEGPGAPELGLRPERLVSVQAGAGEEGVSANAIRCEGYPGDPVLMVAEWVEDESPIAYYGARLRLETSDDLVDAHFVLIDTFTPTETSEDFGGDGRACGVDFNPWN